MGCLTSKKVTPRMFYEAHPQFKKFQTSFVALKLSGGELTCLAEIFREFDLDSSGEISISEFFKSLELKGTSFSERCFALFDYDKSGELDFREFTISLWNYCTADSYALISFAFDLYDLDGSGSISPAEMANVCEEVYGTELEENKRAKLIVDKLKRQSARDNKDSEILEDFETSKKGFHKFCKRHPALLFPAFMLQEQLCTKILSKSFWSKLAKRREKEFGKDEIDIKWLRAQVTRNAFVEIAETIGLGVERTSLCRDVVSREEAARQNQIEERVKQAKKIISMHKRSSRRNLKKRRREKKSNRDVYKHVIIYSKITYNFRTLQNITS